MQLPGILDVAQRLGLPLHPIQGGRQFETPCWKCGTSGAGPDTNRHGHLTINPGKETYRCPRCGYSGNVWTMARDLLGKARGDEFIKDMSYMDTTAIRRAATRPVFKEKPMLDIKTRNSVYAELLKKLVLSPTHRDDLLNRGLTEDLINGNQYKTTPSKDSAIGISTLLAKDGYPLDGIPGFYKNQEGKWTFMSLPGFLVPIRDTESRIQGMQIRVDKRYLEYTNQTRDNKLRKYMWMSSVAQTDGCSSGSPIHIANPYKLPLDRVGITEGPIKADIAASYTGIPFLGIAGTGLYRQAADAAKQLGVRDPLVFYDADKSHNVHVQDNLKNLLRELSVNGLKGRSYTWDESLGKGIDDLLVAVSKGKFPVEKELLESIITIEKDDLEITITKTIKVTINPKLNKVFK